MCLICLLTTFKFSLCILWLFHVFSFFNEYNSGSTFWLMLPVISVKHLELTLKNKTRNLSLKKKKLIPLKLLYIICDQINILVNFVNRCWASVYTKSKVHYESKFKMLSVDPVQKRTLCWFLLSRKWIIYGETYCNNIYLAPVSLHKWGPCHTNSYLKSSLPHTKKRLVEIIFLQRRKRRTYGFNYSIKSFF